MSASCVAQTLPGAWASERTAKTIPARVRSKTVSRASPERTRTPQLEPAWSWIGLRCPFRQHRTSAW